MTQPLINTLCRSMGFSRKLICTKSIRHYSITKRKESTFDTRFMKSWRKFLNGLSYRLYIEKVVSVLKAQFDKNLVSRFILTHEKNRFETWPHMTHVSVLACQAKSDTRSSCTLPPLLKHTLWNDKTTSATKHVQISATNFELKLRARFLLIYFIFVNLHKN